jgi:hypothetical protein
MAHQTADGIVQHRRSPGQGPLPIVGVFDDSRQIVEPRLPSEREQAAIIRNQGNRISDPSLGDAFLEYRSGNAFYGQGTTCKQK